jgi:glutathione reductase (NADPH)
VRARHILIATGAKPQLLNIPGADLAITSDQIFDLPNFPSRLVIAGAGYIALELAGLFASLGSKVAIVCRGDNVLQGFDEDLREAVCKAYERSGIRLIFNDTLMRIEPGSAIGSLTATTHGGISLDADQVLMAIGREPNSAGLGLEAVGVERKSNGAIVVDGHARTNVPGVYAIGDVTDRVNLTPVALREGHAFADRLFGSETWDVDYALIPTAIFSSPEVGTVGMTERQARSAFDSVAIYRTSFRALKEMATGKQQHTLMKVIVDQTSDRILGVHLFAEEASELIQLIAVAVRAGATMRQFLTTMAVHPTLGEELVTLRAPVEIHNRHCE